MIDLKIGDDGVALLTFDTPGEKVNVLGEASLERLARCLDECESAVAAGAVKALVIASGKRGCFLAGADVKAFVPVAATGDAALVARKAREGQMLFSRLADLTAPSVAAINGVCLGGGLELALACTARVAGDTPEVSLALPEVRLGLLPGWGGTQRLPRLVGPSRALDLILTGRTLPARRARRIGLVDRVVPIEGVEGAARAEALRLAAGKRPRRPKWSLIDRNPLGRALIWRLSRRGVLKQTRGHYPAPIAALESVAHGFGRSLDEGLEYEARRLGELMVGDVSKNLVRIFLASRATGAASGRREGAPQVKRIGVIGAGTMGAGIAGVAALAGLGVRMKDVDAAALARGMKQIHALARGAARKGRLGEVEAARREALVSATTDLSGFGRCDLIVEAVVEDLEVKRAVLREVEAAVPSSVVFATNTSSLSVTRIAEASVRPGRVLGLHFFNPVPKMPLVEVVRAGATEDDAVACACAVARRMGKTPVVVKDTPGFIVNRILMPYLGGAVDLLRAGGPEAIVAIDAGLVRFGMPMGPFALLDTIGLDVASKVAGVLSTAFGTTNGSGSTKVLEAMAAAGMLGEKAGRGFYAYSSGKRRGVSRALASVIPPANGSAPPPPDAPADALVDLMVNEAAKLIAEEAVEGPEVIDLAMIFGTGFPPFRGGLLRYADTVGRETIAARLRARGVTPAPLLDQKGRFYP